MYSHKNDKLEDDQYVSIDDNFTEKYVDSAESHENDHTQNLMDDDSDNNCPGNSKANDEFSSCEDLKKSKSLWTQEATRLFIEVYKNKCENLRSKFSGKPTVQNKFWMGVAETMEKNGYKFTNAQCNSKWQSLLRKYKKVAQHNNKSGNDREKWEFFEVIFHEFI